MDFFRVVKQVPRNLPAGERGKGVMPFLVDKGERYGAAAAFGFIKGYYREKSLIHGIPADLLVGGASTLLSAILTAAAGGRSAAAPHLNAIGDAGMMSYFNSIGTSMGAKKSGRQVLVLNAGASPMGIPPAGYTAVGALPQASGGAYLSAEEIAHYNSSR